MQPAMAISERSTETHRRESKLEVRKIFGGTRLRIRNPDHRKLIHCTKSTRKRLPKSEWQVHDDQLL